MSMLQICSEYHVFTQLPLHLTLLQLSTQQLGGSTHQNPQYSVHTEPQQPLLAYRQNLDSLCYSYDSLVVLKTHGLCSYAHTLHSWKALCVYSFQSRYLRTHVTFNCTPRYLQFLFSDSVPRLPTDHKHTSTLFSELLQPAYTFLCKYPQEKHQHAKLKE